MKIKLIIPFTLQLFCTISLPAQIKGVKDAEKPKVFVVLDITVNDSALYEQYRINIEPVIKKYGGDYLVRSGGMAFDSDPEMKVVPVSGNWNPDRLIIIAWNSMEELQKFTSSEEYKKIAVLREKSATTKSVIVKECLKH